MSLSWYLKTPLLLSKIPANTLANVVFPLPLSPAIAVIDGVLSSIENETDLSAKFLFL